MAAAQFLTVRHSRGIAANLPSTLLYVYHRPFQDQAQRPVQQLPLKNFQSPKVDGGFKLAISRMKVWRRMIVEKHSDQDSIERADGRPATIILTTQTFLLSHQSPAAIF
jgi:hypothetical protein